MKLKNNIIFSLFFSFLFFGFIIWNRLIRVRLPKDLRPVPEINGQSILVFFLFIFFLSLTIYYVLKLLKIIPRKNSKFSKVLSKLSEYINSKPFFIKCVEFFKLHVLEGPFRTYEFLYTYIYIRPFLNYIHIKLAYFFIDYTKEIYIIAFVFSRLITSIVFFIEIIFFKKLMLFYILLILLLIPLLVKFILFMAVHASKRWLDRVNHYYIFELNEDKTTCTLSKRILTDPMDIQYQQNSIHCEVETVHNWWMHQRVYTTVFNVEALIEKYKCRLYIFHYGLTTMGFFFYLLILVSLY